MLPKILALFSFPDQSKVRCQPEVPNSNGTRDPAARYLKMWSSLDEATEHVGNSPTWEHTVFIFHHEAHHEAQGNICGAAHLQPLTLTNIFCLSCSSMGLPTWGSVDHCAFCTRKSCCLAVLAPPPPLLQGLNSLGHVLASVCIFPRSQISELVFDPQVDSGHRHEPWSLSQILMCWPAVWYSGFAHSDRSPCG